MLSLRLVKKFPKMRGAAPFCLDLAYELKDEHRSAVLFGFSGSGKTLTLHSIAGLVRPDSGHIRVGERVLYDSASRIFVPARKRKIGLMFQDYALFPHLTLLQNVAYACSGGLGLWPGHAERERARALLERFGIAALENHYPAQLSGGQKQRAALARAVNAGPELLLLDEPFSALDPLLRTRLRGELAELLASLAIPAIIITHDPEDVDVFAGNLVLYEAGRARPVANYAERRRTFSTASACLLQLQAEAQAALRQEAKEDVFAKM